MKCFINALGVSTGGGVRHYLNLLPALGKIDSATEYVVYIREGAPMMECGANFRFVVISEATAKNWLRRNFFDLIKSPYLLKAEKFDLTLSLTNFGPIWSPIKHIFVQQNPIYFSDWFLQNVDFRQSFDAQLRSRLCYESMRHSQGIITPSYSMTKLIIKKYPRLSAREFYSIYHGFSLAAYRDEASPEVKKRLDFKGVKLLYPTLFGFHKGFGVLAKIVLRLRKILGPNFKIYVNIKREEWPEIFEIGNFAPEVLTHVEWLGVVSQASMGYLYRHCDLMIYPSLLESFGFSMLEAMALGLPIIAADTEINREICGNGALYYSAFDADAGAYAVVRALDSLEQKRLRDSGKARYNSYDWSWERCAKEYREALF